MTRIKAKRDRMMITCADQPPENINHQCGFLHRLTQVSPRHAQI